MTLEKVIQEAFSREGWSKRSHNNVRNLYYKRGTSIKNDPLTEKNIKAIFSFLSEDEKDRLNKDIQEVLKNNPGHRVKKLKEPYFIE